MYQALPEHFSWELKAIDSADFVIVKVVDTLCEVLVTRSVIKFEDDSETHFNYHWLSTEHKITRGGIRRSRQSYVLPWA